MTLRLALALSVVAGIALSAMAQSSSSELPHVTLTVPPGIPAETAKINYFMAGPFGGFGGFVTAEKGRQVYDIPASMNGRPADVVKVIAYMPGCEIATLKIAVRGSSQERVIPCVPLGWNLLRGRVDPTPIAGWRPVEVVVNYLAMWSPNFLGYADGPVTQIRIASAVVDETGHFEVELPDFYKQADLGKAELHFTLQRLSGGGAFMAVLKPADENADVRYGLTIRPSREPVLQFPPSMKFVVEMYESM